MLCHRACAIPADASTPVVPAPPCLRRSRSSNHESRITNHESRITAIPALPCAGGLPPQRPPMLCHRACAIPADASTPVVPAPPCLRRSRSSNHESRITAIPALPCAGGLPPQRPPMLCHRACAIPADASTPVVPAPPCLRRSRSSNHESQVTNHESRPFLVRELPPQRPPMLCHRACAIPADVSTPVVPAPPCLRRSRSSNHESRITNHGRSLCGNSPRNAPYVMPPCLLDSSRRVNASRPSATVPASLPQFESRFTNHESRPFLVRELPPQRPPAQCHRAYALPAGVSTRRRPTPPPARFQLAAYAPVVPTPPYMRGSRSSSHESRITNHGSSLPLWAADISNDW